MPQQRAIVGARTSTFNDAKVSHDAQRESGNAYASKHELAITGYFEDLGVSATVTPFERPDLGPWLSERSHEWDVAIWSKVDRAFRSSFDCADVARWAEQNTKCLVFIDDGITVDFRPGVDEMTRMLSKMFLMMASMFAEMELRRFRQRAIDAHGVLKTRDRWATGAAPLGFVIVDHPSGKGKTLAADPEGRAILHDMANRLLSGDSWVAIANHLNETGTLSNRGKRMAAKGKETPTWGVASVKEALTSLRTQGVKLSNGRPVLDSAGEYIYLGEPTFDDETWTQIQSAAAERSSSGKRRVVSGNPILHVGYCECGASLTKRASNGHAYYRCGRTPTACKGVSIKQGEAHELLERIMTGTFGEMHATRRVFVPGSDNSAELETVNSTIRRLRLESESGLIITPEDEADWLARLQAQTAKREQLVSVGSWPSRWDVVNEDDTYAQKYAVADEMGKREIMRNAGIRMTLHKDGEPTINVPANLSEVIGTGGVPVSMLLTSEWMALIGAGAAANLDGSEVFPDDSDDHTSIRSDGEVTTILTVTGGLS